MSNNGADGVARKGIAVLRERLGGVSETSMAHLKEQTRIHKLIRDTLGSGPKTIPQIAVATALPVEKVVWHLMALRRYGQIVEEDQVGDYFRYRLKEVK
ncbi:hypothetical protein JW905_17320 [bacterium]|nr:hypothetical protein [candidate division CSSED10-310 bacterium]